MQYVINAVVMACLFDGSNISRLFNHAYEALVAGGADAVGTRVDVGDVVAHGAKAQASFNLLNCPGERMFEAKVVLMVDTELTA